MGDPRADADARLRRRRHHHARARLRDLRRREAVPLRRRRPRRRRASGARSESHPTLIRTPQSRERRATCMVTRIVHISDLHFSRRDSAVARVLHDAIVQARPDVLLVTGDLADHPSISWPFGRGEWTAARAWLREIERDIEAASGSAVTTLVLPGNHDVLVSGLSGWCWIPGAAFRRCFRPWRRPPVFYHPRANVTFLTLDTNPRLAFFSAEGVAIASRLKQLKRAIDGHPDAARIRTSTKILLMHHHPLPVPFQGSDWLLQTRRGDRLARFVAGNKVPMHFHGHKHRATWSQMRIGGASVEPFFIEVVGAGSAMKWADQDPRGHNFNLVDV